MAGSRASARTAGADTILHLLDDSDDEEENEVVVPEMFYIQA